MNKIITTIVLTGMVLACKSKSENIEPEGKVACKILSHKGYYGGTYLGATGYNFSEIYLYDKTGNLIEFQNPPNTTKYEYNIKGNLLKAIQYTQYFQGPEIKSSETEYFYNADNQLIRQVNNELSWQYTEVLYEYHLNGKMKKRTTFLEKSTTPFTLAEYNEKGNLILVQNKDGSFTKQEYNAADFILKQTNYNPNEKKTTELLYEYNSKNLKLKMLQYINGNLESYENYEYNAKGQEINYTLYLHDGRILTKSITEYTGENYKTSRYFGPDKLMDYTIFEVTNSLLMKKSLYEDNKLMLATVYNYDSHKNMIKREELLGGTTINTSEEWTYQCDQRNAK